MRRYPLDGDGADVAVWQYAEVLLVELLERGVQLACKDAFMAEPLQSDVKAAQPREEVNESHRASGGQSAPPHGAESSGLLHISVSQSRTTVHPSCSSNRALRRSRLRLAFIFGIQYDGFEPDCSLCDSLLQSRPCQKSPSQKNGYSGGSKDNIRLRGARERFSDSVGRSSRAASAGDTHALCRSSGSFLSVRTRC